VATAAIIILVAVFVEFAASPAWAGVLTRRYTVARVSAAISSTHKRRFLWRANCTFSII